MYLLVLMVSLVDYVITRPCGIIGRLCYLLVTAVSLIECYFTHRLGVSGRLCYLLVLVVSLVDYVIYSSSSCHW